MLVEEEGGGERQAGLAAEEEFEGEEEGEEVGGEGEGGHGAMRIG